MAQSIQVGRIFTGLNVSNSLLCASAVLFGLSTTRAMGWADMRSAASRRVATPVVSLNQRTLSRISEDMRASVAPVYAVSSDGDEASELVGLRESHVWQATYLGRTISMERLGLAVDIADKRVREVEAGVLGSRAILAYEDPAQKALVAVLAAGKALYTVYQSQGGSLSVVRVGTVSE